MPENQNTEWKQNWQNDYLKWICGFANAHGGNIFIGIDDNGKPVGLQNYRDLLEEIPNKIRNALGIICEVNLHQKFQKYYLEIVVSPYTVPVSLRGRYYYRSGSTKLELTGSTLMEFLLKKAGKTWDDIVEERASMDDIDLLSIDMFLSDAKEIDRLPDVSGLSHEEMLDKLRLTENGKLKRAALILFGKDPNRFFPNVLVKIGRFGDSHANLKYQEIEEGNLIQLLRSVPQTLKRKFLIQQVSFEGMFRKETNEYPNDAIREMLLNALVHRSYMGSFVQIRVYDNKINIWNEGMLPAGLNEMALKGHHISRPRNLLIADVCFKAGYIDLWGRGTVKIIESCKQVGLPDPEIKEFNGGILVTLFKNRFSEEQLSKLGLIDRQVKAMIYIKTHGSITNKVYQQIGEVSDRTALRDLDYLASIGLIQKIGTKKGRHYTLKM